VRRRRGIPRRSHGVVSSIPPNPATMPYATTLCIDSFTVSGMPPASERSPPTTVRRTRVVVAAPRRPAPRPSRARSACTRAAKHRTRRPARTSVALNTAPDASGNIPSRLKCRCHQTGSEVVSTAVAMPPSRTARMARPHCVGVGGASGPRRAAARTEMAAAVTSGTLHPRGMPPDRVVLGPVVPLEAAGGGPSSPDAAEAVGITIAGADDTAGGPATPAAPRYGRASPEAA
jgi:hypothetical protein